MTAVASPSKSKQLVPIPPDGGWGWVVVLGSFFVHVFADGFVYSFGVLVEVLMKEFNSDNTVCAMIISLLTGLTLGSGPLASAICNKYGCRATTITGALIAAVGSVKRSKGLRFSVFTEVNLSSSPKSGSDVAGHLAI
ncbi:unnamed protein product [Haemonchus placei]|uniref:MFS domain-containing protein n=1 Tax=Haemonchus placei TaxID=6290 RepID=A0A0N4VVM2_HAEPC|nr:unnamed protein product [Haemonchus placei]